MDVCPSDLPNYGDCCFSRFIFKTATITPCWAHSRNVYFKYDKNENVDGEYDESNFDALNDGTDFFDNEDEDDEDLSEFLDDFFNDEDE